MGRVLARTSARHRRREPGVVVRVVVAGTFDPAFKRNRSLRSSLVASGHEVVACNVEVWGSDRPTLVTSRGVRLVVRVLVAQLRLAVRFLRTARGDVVLVQYPGWFDMFVLGSLARLRSMPVVFDPFISLSDTVVSDRALVAADGAVARVLRFIDRVSLRWASRVLADTPEHALFFASLAGIDPSRVGVVWVGADDEVFRPVGLAGSRPDRVLFYGTYIPLHGIATIIEAARRLEASGVEFRLIGDGQERPAIEAELARSGPSNVELVDAVPVERLVHEITEATICLGVFGTSDKALRVVPNKVFECVAVGRPVVTADTPSVRRAFPVGSLALVPPGDPDALAEEIRRLLADPDRRAEMVTTALTHYDRTYSAARLAELLDGELRLAVASRHGGRSVRRHDAGGRRG